jgi:biopolymer transport protein ExbB
MSLLLQITDTAHKIADTVKNLSQTGTTTTGDTLRFGDLLVKGGVIMIPIGVLAVLGLVIFFERYFTIRKASKSEANLLMQIRSSIHTGNLESAIAICRNSNSPLGRMLQKGLLRIGRPIKDIEGAIENIGKLEVAKLEKNIGILGIIAGIAPMFGFLGTIYGVIKIFYDIAQSGNLSIGVISGGLYVKMVTAAAGLFVGMIAYIFYHILNMMVDKVILKLETDAIAEVQTSAMNDIMFFLLLFFLIASTITNPNVIKLTLPKSSTSQSESKKTINVSITSDLKYYVDKKEVSVDDLQSAISAFKVPDADLTIVLYVDKTVAIQNAVQVMDVAQKMNIKLVLATEPK